MHPSRSDPMHPSRSAPWMYSSSRSRSDVPSYSRRSPGYLPEEYSRRFSTYERGQPNYKDSYRERDYYPPGYRGYDPYSMGHYSRSMGGRRDLYRYRELELSREYEPYGKYKYPYDFYEDYYYSRRDQPPHREELEERSPKKHREPPKPGKAPKNDYSQHFVDTRQRPQNFIRDSDLADRFEEYPKLRELIQLKDSVINQRATAPMYLQCDLKTFDFSTLGTKFDVILVDPPWEEYSRRYPAANIPFWTFEEMANLPVGQLADSPSFIWLWCGSEEGLDQGRLLLKKWGFRRCEDIVWVKTNKNPLNELPTTARSNSKCVFHHTKEHALMGIKGTVRRNQDGHLIHANVDTDVIIAEDSPTGQKPEELYHIIQHFSLGRRRIELFGLDHNIRPGWVTIGKDISNSNFNAEKYRSFFIDENGKDDRLLGSTSDIEELRPKSPSNKNSR